MRYADTAANSYPQAVYAVSKGADHSVRCDCEKARKQELKELRERDWNWSRKAKPDTGKNTLPCFTKKSGMGRRFMARTFESYLADDDEKRRAVETVKRVGTFPDREKEEKACILRGLRQREDPFGGFHDPRLDPTGNQCCLPNFRRYAAECQGQDDSGASPKKRRYSTISNRLLVIDDLGKKNAQNGYVDFIQHYQPPL